MFYFFYYSPLNLSSAPFLFDLVISISFTPLFSPIESNTSSSRTHSRISTVDATECVPIRFSKITNLDKNHAKVPRCQTNNVDEHFMFVSNRVCLQWPRRDKFKAKWSAGRRAAMSSRKFYVFVRRVHDDRHVITKCKI